VIVPGHGSAVDHSFAAEQARLLEEVGAMVRRSFEAGIPVDEVAPPAEVAALWPQWMLRSALGAGYAQLACA